MSSKHYFLILIFVFVAVVAAFQILIYNPKIDDRDQLKTTIKETVNKFKKAKLAEKDLVNIQAKLANQEEKLELIKSKFIHKTELSDISRRMKQATSNHNLKLIDFTPAFQNYFSDTSKAPIKLLPFSITVSGKYLNIGRYIESWNDLEFYIISDNISVKKKNSKSNIVEADITGRLYAWAKGRE